MPRLRPQLPVIAAEGHDSRLPGSPGELRHPVRVEAGAGDDTPRLHLTRRRFQHDLAVRQTETAELAAGVHLTAGTQYLFRVLLCNQRVVHDAGARRPQSTDACAMRLDLANPLRADHLE